MKMWQVFVILINFSILTHEFTHFEVLFMKFLKEILLKIRFFKIRNDKERKNMPTKQIKWSMNNDTESIVHL